MKEIIKILTSSGIEPNEARIESKMLMEHFGENAFDKAQFRAETKQPIQYIIGLADFMGEKFIVNPAVLIPRDETEILVRKAIEIINSKSFTSALDIGTGSGCIACGIAKHTDCRVIGVDISTDALNTALDNASKFNLFNKAIFRKSDVYSNIKPGEKFDIIISNPPYIPPSERENIQTEVSFEPDMALYTKDDKGLEFYEKIISGAKEILNDSGYLLFELGFGQADDVKNLMESAGFTGIEIIKDLAGIERVISGSLNIEV